MICAEAGGVADGIEMHRRAVGRLAEYLFLDAHVVSPQHEHSHDERGHAMPSPVGDGIACKLCIVNALVHGCSSGDSVPRKC